jgi:hypothetical protein
VKIHYTASDIGNKGENSFVKGIFRVRSQTLDLSDSKTYSELCKKLAIFTSQYHQQNPPPLIKRISLRNCGLSDDEVCFNVWNKLLFGEGAHRRSFAKWLTLDLGKNKIGPKFLEYFLSWLFPSAEAERAENLRIQELDLSLTSIGVTGLNVLKAFLEKKKTYPMSHILLKKVQLGDDSRLFSAEEEQAIVTLAVAAKAHCCLEKLSLLDIGNKKKNVCFSENCRKALVFIEKNYQPDFSAFSEGEYIESDWHLIISKKIKDFYINFKGGEVLRRQIKKEGSEEFPNSHFCVDIGYSEEKSITANDLKESLNDRVKGVQGAVSLSFEHCRFSSGCYRVISTFVLQHSQTLKTFFTQSSGFNGDASKELKGSFSKCQQLTSVGFVDEGIGDLGVKYIIDGLRARGGSSTTLKELAFSGTYMGSVGMVYLVCHLNSFNLEKLDISNNGLGGAMCIEKLVQACLAHHTLKQLNMSGVCLSPLREDLEYPPEVKNIFDVRVSEEGDAKERVKLQLTQFKGKTYLKTIQILFFKSQFTEAELIKQRENYVKGRIEEYEIKNEDSAILNLSEAMIAPCSEKLFKYILKKLIIRRSSHDFGSVNPLKRFVFGFKKYQGEERDRLKRIWLSKAAFTRAQEEELIMMARKELSKPFLNSSPLSRLRYHKKSSKEDDENISPNRFGYDERIKKSAL